MSKERSADIIRGLSSTIRRSNPERAKPATPGSLAAAGIQVEYVKADGQPEEVSA
jgi:hypothetical protein